ncbi:MAG: chloride channel 3 [Lasallia pustulata]|uniref:Chloride channel 3 n=1 Tax=Lasallia pustulata TaxID=136370 RepID=A0A5M8PJG5_9LECA|nr:MAG: chloride channel 3 [Lasallia pustulata]
MIGHINSMEKQAISRAWNIEKESVGLKVRYIFEMSFIPSRVEEASSLSQRRLRVVRQEDAYSMLSSHLSKEEQALSSSTVGERLPYNDYTTIDWLHDLVKDSFRFRAIHSRRGIRNDLLSAWDSSQGWVAAAIIGVLTACVAFLVDVAEATVSDWKMGYCKTNVFWNSEACCTARKPLVSWDITGESCEAWHTWTFRYWGAYGIYVGFAPLFGIIAASATMLTKRALPAAAPGHDHKNDNVTAGGPQGVVGKTMYMAAGSGIPEIETILSVKAFGATFAVATGMCLEKEGPFVHISTCVAYLVGMSLPNYRDNGRR